MKLSGDKFTRSTHKLRGSVTFWSQNSVTLKVTIWLQSYNTSKTSEKRAQYMKKKQVITGLTAAALIAGTAVPGAFAAQGYIERSHDFDGRKPVFDEQWHVFAH